MFKSIYWVIYFTYCSFQFKKFLLIPIYRFQLSGEIVYLVIYFFAHINHSYKLCQITLNYESVSIICFFLLLFLLACSVVFSWMLDIMYNKL